MTERDDGVTARVRLGRYLLQESLGAGGMGEVFRARFFAAAGVEKEVCIKRIRAERLSKVGAVERFVGEARVSMRLTHAAIVPVFDFGRAGDEYYLAMEWVDGADLKTILVDARDNGDALAPVVAAQVCAEVARALAYAHEAGAPGVQAVIHRDVKPANVLVSRAGDVKLSDFGVATVLGEAETPGAVAGTERYMAPEQRRGEPAEPRSDLYSLGVVLVEMLTPGTFTRADGATVAAAEERSPDLGELARRLLAVAPAQRPGTAREVASALEELVGRARAAGVASPRDDLARRATRAASARSRSPLQREMGPDASFVRDGEADDFGRRMTATTATVVEPDGPAARRRASRRSLRRALTTGLAVVALLFTGAIGWRLGPWRADEPVREIPSSRPRPSEDPPLQSAEPEGARRPAPIARAEAAPAPAAEIEAPAEPPREPVRSPAAPRSARADASESGRRQPASPPRLTPPAPGPESPPVPSPAPALLNVNAVPWAEVHVDGRRAGITPLFGISLQPGRHAVRFFNEPLGAEREVPVELAAGERRDLVIDLR